MSVHSSKKVTDLLQPIISQSLKARRNGERNASRRKGKKSEKLRRKSSRSPAHADAAVIYTALVRNDGSESRIHFYST